MANPQNYEKLVVCINFRAGDKLPSCAKRDSQQIADALILAAKQGRIHHTIETKHCLGQCHKGPTLRFMPGGPYILGLTPDESEEFINLLAKNDMDAIQQTWPGPAQMPSIDLD